MSEFRLVPLHLPAPDIRPRKLDFRLRAEGSRVYVTPLSRSAETWLALHIARSSDAEWSGGSLVLHHDSTSAFVDAVRREGLEVAR